MARHRAVLVALVLAAPALAGEQAPATTWTGTVPSGACKGNRVTIVVASGAQYCCQSGTWAACDPADPIATASTTGDVKAPTCSAGQHYASVDGAGALQCVADLGGPSLPLSGANGGLGQAQPTCGAGQVLTCSGTTCSCTTDQTGVIGTKVTLGSDFTDGSANVWNTRTEFNSPSYPANAVVHVLCEIKYASNSGSSYNQYVAPNGPASPVSVRLLPFTYTASGAAGAASSSANANYTNGTSAPALTITSTSTSTSFVTVGWEILLGGTGGVMGLQFQHAATFTTTWKAGSYCIWW